MKGAFLAGKRLAWYARLATPGPYGAAHELPTPHVNPADTSREPLYHTTKYGTSASELQVMFQLWRATHGKRDMSPPQPDVPGADEEFISHSLWGGGR